MASEAHVHAESPALRVQFDTEAQQKDASTSGMWLFLITEIMFFGGLFLAYTVYRRAYPELFAIASSSLNVYIGAANTVVLLCSSLTMVLAVRAAQLGKTRAIVLFLILTLLLGGVFLGVKAYEWNEKFVEHHIPGPKFPYGRRAWTARPRAVVLLALLRHDGAPRQHMVIGAGLLTY